MKTFFQMPLKKFYTSYDHNQGIHKVCLTSLIMSVKKLESYDMSNAIYLEKRVGGGKTWVFPPPVSNMSLISYDVILITDSCSEIASETWPRQAEGRDHQNRNVSKYLLAQIYLLAQSQKCSILRK